MKYFETDEEFFNIEPQDTIASSLVAGDLKQSKKNAIMTYINAIRIAGGIGMLSFNEEAYSLAQAKATLLSYRYKKLDLEIDHWFNRPSGVKDDFWMTAMGTDENNAVVKPYGECLSRNSYNLSNSSIKEHIKGLIDDTSNITGLNMGHRNAILKPEISTVATGVCSNIFTLEFSEYNNENKTLLAWPSEGITFMETLDDRVFYWNAKFEDKYYITKNTSVKVKCLNTGKEWNFDPNVSISGQYCRAWINPVFGSSFHNQIIWKADNLKVKEGDVYQIEISNLEDAKTGEMEKYTYRAAFKYADIENYITHITSIQIQEPDKYEIPLDEKTKLNAEIDSLAEDKLIKWKSSNPEIVSVTQNGILEVKEVSKTPVTITAYSAYDETIKDSIQVIPYDVQGNITLDKSSISIEKEKSTTLTITNGASENSEIIWKVKTMTNPNVEYDIDDTTITEYLKVETTTDKKTINITAVNAERDNNKYQVIAHIDGKYTVNCDIEINVPISSIRILPKTIGTSITGRVMNLDYQDTSKRNFELKISYTPTNTTDNKDVVWEVGNSNIIQNNGNGAFTVLRGGTTTIKATVGSHTDQITVNITGDSEHLLKGDVNYDGKVTLYDALQILKQAILGGDLSSDELYIMDYNDDENVSLYDALKFLQQAILG